jgi:hypothetical protein
MKKILFITFISVIVFACNNNSNNNSNSNSKGVEWEKNKKYLSVDEIIAFCEDSVNLSVFKDISIFQRGIKGFNLHYHIGKLEPTWEECYTIEVNKYSNQIDSIYRICPNNDYLSDRDIADIINIVRKLKINIITGDSFGNVFFKAFNSENYNLAFYANDKPEKLIFLKYIKGADYFPEKYKDKWYINDR